jgi:hypothetical protein
MTYPSQPDNTQRQPRFVPAGSEQQLPPTSMRYAHTQQAPARQAQMPPQPGYEPPAQQYTRALNKVSLTAAEKFWYVLGCIAFGGSYFAKIPAKKALSDFGLAEMTSAESFWYILMCISFGAGYFAKLPTAKAVSELDQFRSAGHAPVSAAQYGYATRG